MSAQPERKDDGLLPEQPAQEPEPPSVAPLLAVLEAEFGDRFDEAARQRVREQLAGVVRAASAVAAYPLRNGDEPGSVFRALSEG